AIGEKRMTSEPAPIAADAGVFEHAKWSSGIVVLGAVLVALFPLIAGPHYAILMLSAMGYAIALLGLNLLFGYTGLLSFGHAMFLAIGTYTVAYMSSMRVRSFEIILLLAVTIGAAVAVPIGLLCIRYVKIYFSMLTLAFSMLLYSFLYKFYHVTG